MVVVVTGASASVGPVCEALQQAGATVVAVNAEADLDRAVAGRAVEAYVQLPTVLASQDGEAANSLVESVARFLSDGLLSRFRLAGKLLPQLTGDARVVLVGGNSPVPGTAADDQQARLALLRVLAHALRAEEAPRHLRVRVLDHDAHPQTVARIALGEEVPQARPRPQAPDEADDLSYEDWRTQVLGLTSLEF